MEALAIRVRQRAQQQRTMASMASPSRSPFPFIPPHHSEHEPSYPHRRPPRIVISHLKLSRVTTFLTKSIPLTVFSLALVAAIASSAVAIALPSCEVSPSTSPSSSAAPNDSDYDPPAHHQKIIIPPPHQFYDEAMYGDPKLGETHG
ncbi:hypothetical protein VTN00DRAFT_5339 [Thermoascus crustaceus]|uniref:uncharacterized protein n=1 Tax=Thermoascus crustaceus TaxID=5088 RepID=UPI00374333BC